MTPAQLQALIDVHLVVNGAGPKRTRTSRNPAADLAHLQSL